ncbi:DUF6922 domain-containing protein [Nubsella zeaxanthinifaciens]|uniref:DUF6922 domain-containing protein n=1 Tax=Nubsella zeaxanthinifaciens TaxID=392412 RepID=UPI003CFC94D4
MALAVNISNIFPPYLFWDMDASKLDVKSDKDIIIPRALFATTADSFENDIKTLESLYTRAQILIELKATKERISNQVCNLVAKRYHVKQFSRF